MENKLTVWVFQTGEPLQTDGGSYRPMRAMNLCDALIQSGHKVVLWSSAFFHQEKRHRCKKNKNIVVSENFQVRLLYSRGYDKNIGLERLVDHAHLAFNLNRALKKEKGLPDVAFVGYPPIETAAVLIHWLNKKGVPCLLDIKDQWPTIFTNALPIPLKFAGKILLWPYFYLAKQTMKNATGISAMSNGFVDWAVSFSGRDKTKNDAVFPLTAAKSLETEQELDEARRWWDEQGIKDDGRARFCFIGSLSPAFDFMPIKEAALLFEQSETEIQFIICGEGDSAGEIKEMMNGLSTVFFPGWIDRPKIKVLSERCFAAFAPYVNSSDFVLSLPNKIIDSMLLGLPILSPLEGEVESLISEKEIGLSYQTKTGRSFFQAVQEMIQEPSLKIKMAKNAKQLYIENFSYEMVYSSLVSHLETLSHSVEASNGS